MNLESLRFKTFSFNSIVVDLKNASQPRIVYWFLKHLFSLFYEINNNHGNSADEENSNSKRCACCNTQSLAQMDNEYFA